MHKTDILKMRCHFAKDDTGTIWFVFACNIFARDIQGADQAVSSAKLVKYINKEH
jgi:hypothetical protein